jgi:hypothetical protein
MLRWYGDCIFKNLGEIYTLRLFHTLLIVCGTIVVLNNLCVEFLRIVRKFVLLYCGYLYCGQGEHVLSLMNVKSTFYYVEIRP